MGLCTLGVSGGLAVQNQTGGVTLSQAGDFAVIPISYASPPNGPDLSGIWALTGSFGSAVITPQLCMFGQFSTNINTDPVGATGTWQFLQNCIRYDTNNYITSSFQPSNASALQINPGSVSGLYAIRIYLNSIGSGTMLVAGNTNPQSVATFDALIYAALQANVSLNKAQVLALSDMNSTDYLAAVGGSF